MENEIPELPGDGCGSFLLLKHLWPSLLPGFGGAGQRLGSGQCWHRAQGRGLGSGGGDGSGLAARSVLRRHLQGSSTSGWHCAPGMQGNGQILGAGEKQGCRTGF